MQRSGLTIQQIETLVDETLGLIAVTAQSLADAKPRASRFLVVCSILSTFLKELQEEMPAVSTLERATYSQAIINAPSKQITEKKVQAEADVNYTSAREQLEKLGALKRWIEDHIRIFDNAHILYRQYSRD